MLRCGRWHPIRRPPMSMGLAALTLGLTVLFVCASFVAPLGAQAQQEGKVYRIGFLRAGRPPETWVAGFQQGLRERGYVVGQNIAIEYRFPEGSFDQLPRVAEELVRLHVDVLIAAAGPAAAAAQKVTTSVPIVFVAVHSPVEIGLVSSLARPGGNSTGLALTAADLGGKRLELLKGGCPQAQASRSPLPSRESGIPGPAKGSGGRSSCDGNAASTLADLRS